jgi:competence protein ComEC
MVQAWLGAQANRQVDRWTLWTPVALGVGAAVYFTLPREPQAWVAWVGMSIVVGLLSLAARGHGGRAMTIVMVLTACLVGGFTISKIRTERVKAPIAAAATGPQRIEGWVVDVANPGQGGQRLLVAPARIGGWPPEATPIRVRVTLRPGA